MAELQHLSSKATAVWAKPEAPDDEHGKHMRSARLHAASKCRSSCGKSRAWNEVQACSGDMARMAELLNIFQDLCQKARRGRAR